MYRHLNTGEISFLVDMDIQHIISELSTNEKKVLLTLKKLKGSASPKKIQEQGDFSQSVEVMNAGSWLQAKQLIKIEETITKVYSLGKEGEHFLKNGLPEKRALSFITKHNDKATIQELSSVLLGHEIPVAIGWLKQKKWATITKEKGTILTITPEGKKAVTQQMPEENILQDLHEHPDSEIDASKIKSLLTRKNVIKEKERIHSTFSLTSQGKQVLDHGFTITEEISLLTPEMIQSGTWKDQTLRPYDIHVFAPSQYGGKTHPLVALIDHIRQIFLELGFTEIQGQFVESSFWNMDVLFIPQDHPARDMQDTLYCKKPSSIEVPQKQIVQKVKTIHENGGDTSSTGWNYDFSLEEGKKALLRTHTTVNTIRYLSKNPSPPSKVFSIGKVFRRENIDTTHLAEFYQIEGIIHEETATFRQLIGILKEFYKRMGFEKIRCRPGYFPYTEPSMEIDVFWNNQWMELGGSGIFRPEVTAAVGVTTPVLAWGLGLERLAMLKYKQKDMRRLYVSDLNWLHDTALL